MARKYELNGNLEMKRARFPIWGLLGWVLSLGATSLVLALVYYIVFSVFFKTEEQRALERENEMYEQLYARMEEQEALIRDVVEGLGVRDEDIYREVFHTQAPDIDIVGSYGLRPLPDTLSYVGLIGFQKSCLDRSDSLAGAVVRNIRRIHEKMGAKGFQLPPVGMPVDNLTYPQVGASTGERMNPYYKVPSQHNGVDIIGQQGSVVRSTAEGVVKDIVRSKKGDGNAVVIGHAGGYVTKYAHLDDIKVEKGQHVSKGRVIGTLGVSGQTYAPHLHYEVRKDGQPLDPVGFFLAGVSPTDYANMLFMASRTQQSLD